MLIPVWLDEAVVGDGVDLTVGGPFGDALRFYGQTDPYAGSGPVENLLVEGEQIAVAGAIEGVIGSTSRPPLVVVRCCGPRIIASSHQTGGTATSVGRLDVEEWCDEIDAPDDLGDITQLGVVRSLQLIEARRPNCFPGTSCGWVRRRAMRSRRPAPTTARRAGSRSMNAACSRTWSSTSASESTRAGACGPRRVGRRKHAP